MGDFTQLSQLLFDTELLASRSAVVNALEKYRLAVQYGGEYIGLRKNPNGYNAVNQSRVYKGTDGTNIGILSIKGSLVYEESGWESLCGFTSYEGLQNKAIHMIRDRDVKHLILEINSGGGIAYGCFETAQFVKDLAKEHDVKITSYVDGVAYSGGYAWCCIADEVIVNPMGRVGSIGVVLPLVNYSEAEKKEGIQRVYVTAGKSKVPYDKDGKFTDEALSDMKEGVIDIYKIFVDHVATNRNISTESVENTEAKLFTSKKGKELGLIDHIMTKEEFYAHLGNFNGENTMSLVQKPQGENGADVATDQPETKIELGADNALIAQLSTRLSASEALTTQIQTDLATANATIADLTAQVSTLKGEKADAIQEARKDKISALVADDQVEFHVGVVSGFSDEKFAQYVDHLEKVQGKVEEGFVEQGHGGDDDKGKEALSVSEQAVLRLQSRKQAN